MPRRTKIAGVAWVCGLLALGFGLGWHWVALGWIVNLCLALPWYGFVLASKKRTFTSEEGTRTETLFMELIGTIAMACVPWLHAGFGLLILGFYLARQTGLMPPQSAVAVDIDGGDESPP